MVAVAHDGFPYVYNGNCPYFHSESEVVIPLCFQLFSACYTPLQMKNT